MTAETITDILVSLVPFPLSHSWVKSVHGLLVIDEVPRKEQLLEAGQICDRVYFVEKGLVRAYYTDEIGAERTSWFMKDLDVITSPRSFFNREPSQENIETLEPTIVGSISYDEMEWLYKEFIEFNVVGRILNQRYNVLADIRASEQKISDASIRYRNFLRNYPELAKRVPTKYIASYIGVDETTLYKIKNGTYNPPRKDKKITEH